MIVVSNASPLRYLVLVDAADILPGLFGGVFIPPAVHAELQQPNTPETVRRWIALPPAWLTVRAPSLSDPSLDVHIGEAEAIRLAQELNAERLLIDDKKAIVAARARGLRVTRTLAVIMLAGERGLIDLSGTIQRLKRTNFRVPHGLLDEIVQALAKRSLPRNPPAASSD